MDFSVAQRNGFSRAFVTFHKECLHLEVNEDKLMDDSLTYLKGCEFHYKQGVQRVQKSGVISFEQRDQFRQLAYSLLEITDADDFAATMDKIEKDFPNTKNWMTWWRDPKIAGLIFPSQQRMPADRSAEVPSTSNAEEAIHATLYLAWKRHNNFYSGCVGLYEFASFFERQYNLRLRK